MFALTGWSERLSHTQKLPNGSGNLERDANRFRHSAVDVYTNTELSGGSFFQHKSILLNALVNDLPLNPDYQTHTKPVCQYLEECLKSPEVAFPELTGAIAGFSGRLHWQINQKYVGVFDDHFLQNEAFVEIIGPTGLLLAPSIRVGLLLLGKAMHYPSHAHEATELYRVVSGTGLWRQGKSGFSEAPPGKALYHDVWEPHEMKTVGLPVLALFSWTGAISSEATPMV